MVGGPMWTLAVLLWVAVAPAVVAGRGCLPSIQLNGTGGGGQILLLGARISSCDCQRLGIFYQRCDARNSTCSSTSHRLTRSDGRPQELERTDSHLWAQATVHLTGRYFAKCCDAADSGACYQKPKAEVWVDGINYDQWNVSISVQQQSGDRPTLNVEVANQYPTLGFYVPKLSVTLRDARNNWVDDGRIEFPKNNSYVFGRNRDQGLAPGLYKIVVKPRGLICGDSCRARYLFHNVTAPERPSLGQVAADTATSRTLYLALGVPAGLAMVVLVVFLNYKFLCGLRGRRWLENLQVASHKSPLPSLPVPAVPVSVLLLHRGGGGGGTALDQLRAALRAAGIVLLDARERYVLNLMQIYSSPADLLALEAFRDARLLFVGGGDGGGGGPAGSVPDRMYDNVLKFVRNGRLGLDYGRVFTATLEDAAGEELVGLVEGRLFRVPDDVPLLVEHILCARRPDGVDRPVARTDLLPAMVQSPGSNVSSLQSSPV